MIVALVLKLGSLASGGFTALFFDSSTSFCAFRPSYGLLKSRPTTEVLHFHDRGPHLYEILGSRAAHEVRSVNKKVLEKDQIVLKRDKW